MRATLAKKSNSAWLEPSRACISWANQGNGKPLLLLAVESKHGETVVLLAGAGADVDDAGTDGTTPLAAAAASNDPAMIKSLLAAGAHADRTDKDGRTAFWHAANRDAFSAIPALSSPAVLNRADRDGMTPLAAAVGRGNNKAADALLKAGADARLKTRNDNTVLHLAAAAGHATLIAPLVAARAPVDAVNSHGDTALMLGVKARCLACARGLLAAGASTRMRNKDGLSALDIARLTREPSLVKLFE